MASRFRVYIAVSLDGFVSSADGGVEWLEPFQEDEDYGWEEFSSAVGTIVMGRRTYEQTRTFEERPGAGKRVIVLASQEPADLPEGHEHWGGTTGALLAQLRADEDPDDVWILGGPATIASFVEHGVVSLYEIFVMPVLLGRGAPLWPGADATPRIRLVDNHAYDNGVVRLRYVAAD